MKKNFLFVFLFLSTQSWAQYQSANWFFGQYAGITFSNNPPTSLSGGQINQQEGCCSISDADGNLLFYSDGLTVWDRNHNIMPNGTGLLGGVSSTQSSIVVHDPGGDPNKYYLFTAPQQDTGLPLAYSIIDLSLNSGNGDVTSTKNVSLFAPSTEKVTAVFHRNGIDVWIIGHEFNSNNFRAYLLTASGLSTTPVISSSGSMHEGAGGNTIGYLKASPCGNKIAAAVWNADFLELFDFNDSTGVVSNAIHLGDYSASSGVYGLEFSPDNSKLYASIITPGIVLQYDLLAGSSDDIIASIDTIGTSPVNFNGALQTGPDAKIYLVKYGSGTLDVIQKPNEDGDACGYIQDYVSLGTGLGQLGLPDFFSSFFCNIVGVPEIDSKDELSVFPNPASDIIHVAFNSKATGEATTLRVFNSIGQCVYFQELHNSGSQTEVTVPLNGWSSGIYFLSVQSKKQIFSSAFTRL